ncbi:hypothetical protein NDU88_007020 [Pleurodeles waltl]|uniref:Uncharacterized protein n=1 Tax=Pleurodeles waltl TaxID=8319 RepID=A0AAV7LU77_PLEWA|nr:hypothetical protein NDU88_007020 [Pleurodeles waltl]
MRGLLPANAICLRAEPRKIAEGRGTVLAGVPLAGPGARARRYPPRTGEGGRAGTREAALPTRGQRARIKVREL